MTDPIIEAAAALQREIEATEGLPPEILAQMDEIMKILLLAASPAGADTDAVARLVSRLEPAKHGDAS